MHRLVIALVTLIGLTGAAFLAGYLLLFSASTDRAAALAPANSAFYVNVYLQPSTGQQMNLAGLIGRLPGFADDASLDEKVDQVVQNLLGSTGLDYRADVKPWLGDQVAIAGWPVGNDVADAQMVVIAEVRDRPAAEAAVARLTGDAGQELTSETYKGVELQVGATASYAFVGEMLAIGPSAASLQPVVDVDGGAESLADRDVFRTTMASLESDHLAAAFVDLAAIAEASGMAEQLSGVSTAGAVLVAGTEGLRLSGSAPFAEGDATPSSRAGFALGGEPSSLVDWMPEDTLAEVVIFGLRQTLEDAESAIGAVPQGEEIGSALDTLRALAAFGLGIDLDADVLPLLDREVGIAVTGFDGTLPSGQILLRPEDADAAAASLASLTDALGGVGGTVRTETVGEAEITILTLPDTGEVAYTLVDGIVILGFGPQDVEAALSAHESGATLGSSDAYARTFELAGTRAGNEAYVDVGAIVDMLGDPATLPDDARDILLQLGAFGFTAPSRDDQIEFHAVLTVEDPQAE